MSPAKKEDGKARFLIVLLAVLGIGLLAIPFFLVPPASLEIAVRDAVFGLDLAAKEKSATLQLGDGEALPVSLERDGQSVRALVKRVPSGQGSLRLNVKGYQEETITYDVAPLAIARLTQDLTPTFGRLDLTVVNARNEAVLVPEKVSTKKLIEKPGTTEKTEMPEETLGGPNPYALSPGEHTVVAKAKGFCSGEKKVTITMGKTVEETLPLSPELTGDQVARFILDWGANPRDLDSHLFLTDSTDAGPSAHVFFVNKRGVSANGQVLAELDVDHTQSEGFETVTVYNRTQGTYSYLVHLYAGEGTLGGSQATVQIRTGTGCTPQILNVPETCRNRWWHVADLKLDGGRTTVTTRGECLEEPPTSWKSRRKVDAPAVPGAGGHS